MNNIAPANANRRRFLSHTAKVVGLGAAAALLPVKRCLCEEAASPRFKYAMCNEMYGDWPFEKVCNYVAENGYEGLEIAPFTLAQYAADISAQRRTAVRKQAERAGLAILGLHWLLAKTEGFHLTTEDAAVRRKTAEYFSDLARLCADLGGQIMVLGSPKQRDLAPGMSKAQGMKNAAEVLQAAAPVLEKTGVTIALEPLAAKETNFMTTAAEGVELMNLIGSPNVRLHLDCKAMSSEPTPIPELIHQFQRETVHFHANDPNRQGPGFGELDFAPIMKALADVHYQGWVSVEALDYTPGVERLTQESIHYMKQCAAKIPVRQ